MSRIIRAVLGLAVLGGALLSGVPASAAATSPPAGGPVQLFALPGSGAIGSILVTGAIGDHGTSVSVNQNGKADTSGNYVKITLKNGAFEGNDTALNSAANRPQPTFNTVTCSGSVSISGPVTLFGGSGLYAGIGGTITITETSALILPRYASGSKKGQCNESASAKPLAEDAFITGSGTVSFG
jgi:hypothetical protein